MALFPPWEQRAPWPSYGAPEMPIPHFLTNYGAPGKMLYHVLDMGKFNVPHKRFSWT